MTEGFSQIPNMILDAIPQMKSAEMRLILAVCRATIGWQQQEEELSLTDLQRITGMSRQGVVNALEQPYAKRFIQRRAAGTAFFYSVQVVNGVDQPADASNQYDAAEAGDEVVNGVDQSTALTSQPRRPEVVNGVDQYFLNKELNKDLVLQDARARVREEGPFDFLSAEDQDLYLADLSELLEQYPDVSACDLAYRRIVSNDHRAIIPTRWLLKVGSDPPTGHGWPKLLYALYMARDARGAKQPYAAAVLQNLERNEHNSRTQTERSFGATRVAVGTDRSGSRRDVHDTGEDEPRPGRTVPAPLRGNANRDAPSPGSSSFRTKRSGELSRREYLERNGFSADEIEQLIGETDGASGA